MASASPQEGRRFIPAAGRSWLLPFYDPVQRWLLGERRLKQMLVDHAAIGEGARVLEIGCGTGSLALLLKQRHPEAEVVGLDPDPAALALARRKARRSAVAVTFERGFADHLPHPCGSFDRVLSSLMLHHLSREEKCATLAEVRRVLRPGGSLHLLDFGVPRGLVGALTGPVLRRAEQARDNVEGRIPELLAGAGLERVEELGHRPTLVGTLSFYRAGRT